MVQKPKIQYIGQFYVHGSEAKKLELLEQKKKARNKLPMARLQQIETIYVDPVALVAMAVAVVMLVVMLVGALQIHRDWQEYERVCGYMSYLNKRNAELTQEYHSKYDIEEVRTKAMALGLVPKAEVETMSVSVHIPEPEPEVSRIEEIKDFLEGLFA